MDELDLSFKVPSFFPSENVEDVKKDEKSLSDYLDIISDYDKKIDELSKENVELRFDNRRMRLALELISSYIGSLK